MADYRLFLLNAGDRIDRALILTCEDDEQAIAEMALNSVTSAGAELWLGHRLVHRIAPISKTD